MKKIERILQSIALHELNPQQTIIVSGPQGVGKTQFLQNLFNYYEGKCFLLNAANPDDRKLLLQRDEPLYHRELGNKAFLLIDEAQHIPNIGELLQFIKNIFSNLKILQLSSNMEKQAYLNELFDTYLTRDILNSGNKNKMIKVINLLRLIGYLIGHEIFYREMEKKLSMSRHTVEKYLHICSDLSIIHKLKGYRKNLKKEVTNNVSWYFMDNGIRNAITGNFSPLAIRDDTEVLWKNYLIAERIKKQQYSRTRVRNYFWRTYDQQELDMVEQKGGHLYGYRFSWDEDNYKIPIAWRKAYPRARFRVITPENYQDWIG